MKVEECLFLDGSVANNYTCTMESGVDECERDSTDNYT